MPKIVDLEKKRKKRTDKEVEAFERGLEKLKTNTFQGFKAAIEKVPVEGPQQQVFGFLPTKLTRISPFFPMSKRDMKSRPLEELTWKNPWGTLTTQGKRLSVYDESVLLAVLTLVRKRRSRILQTNTHELLTLMNVSPGRDPYKALWGSLQRLTAANVTIEILEKGKVVEAMSGSMIAWTHAQGKDSPKSFALEVNHYFFEMFGAGLLTNLDLEFRAALTGDTAKALYRFYEGQRNQSYQCHLLTIAGAINLNLEMETRRLRTRIRTGLRELKKRGYLDKWSLNKSDVVSVSKSKKPKV